ncbi:MAG: agglutinin biogenesis protein MshP [Pseudomonadota bacterium]
MKRKPFSYPERRAGGAGLVTAIFLLVVLAGLAVALVTLFGTQRQSAALDEQGARAYQAARAGIEWGLFQRATNPTGYCAAEGAGGGAAQTDHFALPAGPANARSSLAGFVVTVQCWMIPGPASQNGAVNLDRRRIRATACTGPLPAGATCLQDPNGADQVRRAVEVQI